MYHPLWKLQLQRNELFITRERVFWPCLLRRKNNKERIVLQDKSSMNCLVIEERNRKLNHQIEEVVASDVVAITSNPKLQLNKSRMQPSKYKLQSPKKSTSYNLQLLTWRRKTLQPQKNFKKKTRSYKNLKSATTYKLQRAAALKGKSCVYWCAD